MARFPKARSTALGFLSAGLLAALLLVPAGTARAHPHVWIDLTTTVVLDAEGRITALRIDWLFDEFYSLAVFEEDLNTNGDELVDASEFQAFADQAAENLEPYNYFTELAAGESALTLGPVTEASAAMEGGRLRLAFLLPLAEPLAPEAGPLTYSVFDPTFYIEILHAEEKPIAFQAENAEAAAHCSRVILPPNPDAETMAFASSLDQTESGGSDLGQAFAEQVTIDCRRPAG